MEEEDDDFYAPSEPVISTSVYPAVSDSAAGAASVPKEDKVDDELEEGEEEEEEEVESDSVRLKRLLPTCAYSPPSRI
jgi:ribosomal protein L12E/L44/L45/RPP1/RPP2